MGYDHNTDLEFQRIVANLDFDFDLDLAPDMGRPAPAVSHPSQPDFQAFTPSVSTLSDVELLREFSWLRQELCDRVEWEEARTQYGRDLHSRRAACQYELRRRGVIGNGGYRQALVAEGDFESAQRSVLDHLKREVAAHEVIEVINYAENPRRFREEKTAGLGRRAAELRRSLAFVDPFTVGDQSARALALHEEWESVLGELQATGTVDFESAVGVGLELALAAELLCGDYLPQIGFYDVSAATAWADVLAGRLEDLPAEQWLFVVDVR